MKLLFIAKQKKNVDAFGGVIAQLLASGHRVALAIQDRDEERDLKLLDTFSSPAFSLQTCPVSRSDEWLVQAPLIRRLRDWAQYLKPEYAGAGKLRQRTIDKLRKELGPSTRSLGDALSGSFDDAHVDRLTTLLEHIEASIPSDPLHEEFIAHNQPDVVLVTPGIHFGSAQADFIKSARATGIPVWMLLFSWDNLSTKGALHVFPDLMFVWNERQRREAAELHRFPADRVLAVGAPRFDEFFALRPGLSRTDFLTPLGLNPDVPTVLYLCSSRFVAQHELPFVRRWLTVLRTSSHSTLATCNVVVRPHPDIALLGHANEGAKVEWPGFQNAAGFASRPFDDPRAIVLATSGTTQQPLFECLFHSSAVVGLNTSGALEAGIVGRPVLTVLADDEAVTGQSNTLHFHYLLQENGGFVQMAPNLDAHADQLHKALTDTQDDARIRRFVDDFLRPCGNRPVSAVLADALVARGAGDRGKGEGERTKGEGGRAKGEGQREQGAGQRGQGAGPVGPGTTSRWEPAKTLRLAYPESGLRVWATRETRKARRPGELLLDEGTIDWLDEHVQSGDIVYDVGAGIGAYSLVAAVHRSALVVAFEPEFASHKRLCDNILLNNCRRRVMPLPIALGDRTGLFELEQRRHTAAEDSSRSRPWRNGLDGPEWRYSHPVCVEPLDDVVMRRQLPRAQHIRIAVPRAADAVLRGATALLRHRSVKSLLVTVPSAESATLLSDVLGGAGLALLTTHETRELGSLLLFVSESAAARHA